ncbi:hypothetical protein [Halanaerobacter jeridensis]|uniref:Polyhydroxyalkanoate synthesis regulator phasin n=1 Tax=Halanaerobacter jeridensis TaxID=706427 RepID=A0A938XXG7_9FIRM|nr:hypothetical protein [Halanaerobacter jeridensis]MBM7557432.1 polyhydroxyalkanoate synthesis regulator phasin [Halanaerobacter jeridensis]
MLNKKIDQLIDEVVAEGDIMITPNQEEQVKSILLKRCEEAEWNGANKEEVKEVINCVNSSEKISELDLSEEIPVNDNTE